MAPVLAAAPVARRLAAEAANAAPAARRIALGAAVAAPAAGRAAAEVVRPLVTIRPERSSGPRPDRVALWAVLLGLLLMLLAAGTSEGATTLGDRTLKAGMEGRDVRHLQLRLKRLRFLDAPATARFGAQTRRAVRAYQRSRCLRVDGVAGAGTVRALRSGRRACRRAASPRPRRPQPYRRMALGRRVLDRGSAGSDVRTLQRLIGVASDGRFGPATTRAVRRLQRRAGLKADGRAGPSTLRALASRRMRARRATWYGPGLYGNRTACGAKMTRRLRGVAHKRLPCGTPVTLSYGGRFVTVRVVDRGPYAHGAVFDLTAATARSLRFRHTGSVRAAY